VKANIALALKQGDVAPAIRAYIASLGLDEL
jgi:hypothetical protein